MGHTPLSCEWRCQTSLQRHIGSNVCFVIIFLTFLISSTLRYCETFNFNIFWKLVFVFLKASFKRHSESNIWLLDAAGWLFCLMGKASGCRLQSAHRMDYVLAHYFWTIWIIQLLKHSYLHEHTCWTNWLSFSHKYFNTTWWWVAAVPWNLILFNQVVFVQIAISSHWIEWDTCFWYFILWEEIRQIWEHVRLDQSLGFE